MTYTVLIADDELHARRYLHELLSSDEELILLGECKSGEEVLRFLKNQVPDLLFLDIKMPGTNGLSVAQQIQKKDCEVIFTTAYDQYAVKAFEAEAFDYLLKPFSDARLQQVVQRAKAAIQNQRKLQVHGRIQHLLERFAHRENHTTHLTEFIIKIRGLEQTIPISEVCYLQSSSVYVELVTQTKSHLYRSALSLLEKQLPPAFRRIHRSILINAAHISSHKYLNNNRFRFRMSNGTDLISSKAFKSDIAGWIA